MNPANLQLEGLYLAIAAVNNALVAKGLLSRDELALALQRAEHTALGDYRADDLSSAQRDAMAFPARLLLMALNTAADGFTPPFSELAKLVGQTKEPHNDPM
jgi:hypothetical protein